MSGHTPAPWIALPYDENAGYDCMYPGVRIESATGLKIVVVDEGDYIYSHDDRPDMRPLVEANARLIAAAPDLLDELINLTARFKAAVMQAGTDEEFAELAVTCARAAIAKATGSQS